MELTLPLDKMTTAEKLRVIEDVWEDLCRTAEDVPSPSWHADVLQAREKRIQEGASRFVAWPEGKDTIRDRAK